MFLWGVAHWLLGWLIGCSSYLKMNPCFSQMALFAVTRCYGSIVTSVDSDGGLREFWSWKHGLRSLNAHWKGSNYQISFWVSVVLDGFRGENNETQKVEGDP